MIALEKKNQERASKRYIGKIENGNGPTVIYTAAMHGNEPSGVIACKHVFERLEKEQIQIKGNLYGLIGNVNAYEKGIRFEEEDLNRLWENQSIPEENSISERKEYQALYQELEQIISKSNGAQLYTFDLHTTSSPTPPFVIMNNNELNHNFIESIPVIKVSGLENVLQGTLLSYMSDRGAVSLAYEAGSHNHPDVIAKQEAFIWLTLIQSGLIDKDSISNVAALELKTGPEDEQLKQLFNLIYRYELKEGESFAMKAGYVNFQEIQKGELLAHTFDKEIRAKYSGRIFMPLYQKQGSDGFFIIESTL